MTSPLILPATCRYTTPAGSPTTGRPTAITDASQTSVGTGTFRVPSFIGIGWEIPGRACGSRASPTGTYATVSLRG